MATYDYMVRDYDSYLEEMKNLIAVKAPQWTDTSDSDFGMVILQVMAAMLDKLAWYQDRIINEAFLDSAIERKSVINHCRLLGYQATGATPAKVLLKFELDSTMDEVTIPLKTRVEGTNISFETYEDANNIKLYFTNIWGYQSNKFTSNYYNEAKTEGQTFLPINLPISAGDGLYIGYSQRFDGLDIKLYGKGKSILGNWEYLNENGRWTKFTIVTDTTVENNYQFMQSGKVQWEVPINWSRNVLQGINIYWARFNITSADLFSTIDTIKFIDNKVYVYIKAQEGETVRETIGYSDGSKNQVFELDVIDIDNTSIKVYVDNKEWTKASSFVLSTATDEHYLLNVTTKINIEFGNNIHGKIPADGSDIDVEYRIVKGSEGNVGKNSLTKLPSAIKGVLSVTNPDIASGGIDSEDINTIKVNAINELRAFNRAVTIEDFVHLVKKLGVNKCYAESVSSFIVKVYILNKTPITETLKENILTELNNKKMLGLLVILEDGIKVKVDIKLTFKILKGYDKTTVKDNIETAIKEYFNFDNVDFGYDIRLGNIYSLIEVISGVDYIKIDKLCRSGETGVDDVIIGKNEIPELGVMEVAY